jgi:tripartite-type tricarboxylate transporter receptor subunit TctC
MRQLARQLSRAIAAAGFALCAATAFAQGYPTQSVRVIVPYAAGGGMDSLARLISQKLSSRLGQQFIVENRPGAGGIAGTDLVAKAAPNGYTLLMTDTQLEITPALFKTLPYNVAKDIAPVSLIATEPLFFAARTADHIDSLKGLIDLIKANPGKYNYGSPGIGSMHHLAMEAFKADEGLNLVHLPFKGTGESITAFLRGDVLVLVASSAAITPYVKDGSVKLLATTSLKRSPYSPDVPAVSETVPGYDFATDLGIFAPAATPPAVATQISGEVAAILKEKDIITQLANVNGAIPVGSTPAEYGQKITAGLEQFQQVVKAADIKPQ